MQRGTSTGDNWGSWRSKVQGHKEGAEHQSAEGVGLGRCALTPSQFVDPRAVFQ